MDSLEMQLKRFPKGAHDDIIDALQMLYDLYTIAPQSVYQEYNIKIDYDANGIPIYS
jgi:phage terminase large subunit-like protein